MGTSKFSGKDILIKKFFESELDDQSLDTFLRVMFIEPNDYYIHHTDYTDYIYNNAIEIANQLTNQAEYYYKQNIESLQDFIDNLQEKDNEMFVKAGQNYNDLLVIPKRLHEHIRLAQLQYDTFFSEVKNSNNLRKDLEISRTELKEAGKKIDESSNNMISLLGVFSSFIFLLFGGFQALSKIISVSLETSVSLNKILFVASILIFFIFTVIYFMLFWVGNMTGRSIVNTNCDCKNDEKDKNNKTCNNIQQILRRHASYLVVAIPTLICAIISFLVQSENDLCYIGVIVLGILSSIITQFIINKLYNKSTP